MRITARDHHIVRVNWVGTSSASPSPDALLAEAAAQLRAYFDGTRTDFDLPLAPSGGAFQRAVCEAMRAIPFGETRTYGELAAELGSAAQAVGQACGGNSIPVLIPCHRVLAADGLGGYSGAGGVETKIALLKHEHAFPYLL